MATEISIAGAPEGRAYEQSGVGDRGLVATQESLKKIELKPEVANSELAEVKSELEKAKKELAELRGDEAAAYDGWRWARALFAAVSPGFLLFGIALVSLFGLTTGTKICLLISLLLSLLALGVAAVCAGALSAREQLRESKVALRESERVLEGLEPEKGYFARLATMNWKSLEGQYKLVERQCGRSFLASMSVGLAGFVLIAAGLVVGFDKGKETIGIVSTASGILTEFISGVFFVLFIRTVRQMRAYHAALVEVQNVLLSFKIVDRITDVPVKDRTIANLVDLLMKRNSSAAVNADDDERLGRPSTGGEPAKRPA